MPVRYWQSADSLRLAADSVSERILVAERDAAALFVGEKSEFKRDKGTQLKHRRSEMRGGRLMRKGRDDVLWTGLVEDSIPGGGKRPAILGASFEETQGRRQDGTRSSSRAGIWLEPAVIRSGLRCQITERQTTRVRGAEPWKSRSGLLYGFLTFPRVARGRGDVREE
ncbi:hypothetical protein B0H17DRAFT_1179254 [Mycena rosella]|uniref:Uncharacterized protein n=1 Tax=Mycena rosella TaxID=1033263 RepID=A0AAD7DII1_MYCRO|nr:hypothetical protein B0H17DRAFT_1179254 [Mycena rosella]